MNSKISYEGEFKFKIYNSKYIYLEKLLELKKASREAIAKNKTLLKEVDSKSQKLEIKKIKKKNLNYSLKRFQQTWKNYLLEKLNIKILNKTICFFTMSIKVKSQKEVVT
ncbi:hypothetical protein SCLARK_00253 [Spiroplasma clarkii]|uniref:hypothetical protein n=1 Tax=Spiroplasma clarkii TaxID=2139 RepID=UPI000B56AF2E|nr:hypothetical protein [Spiroplasma clarkii]ARU91013.1 hypothetical protein SCLARK_00253 [Spiroplasma clarkii]